MEWAAFFAVVFSANALGNVVTYAIRRRFLG